MDNLSSPDFLSDLPLSIIHVILSLVPIRDAVRTSSLSRKWRYMWSSLPHLAFDENCVNPPMANESDKKRLIIFISQALLLHEGTINKFELRLPPMVNSRCINQWLLFLSRNGIRILVLESDDFVYGFEIPSSLYSCQSLTELKLHVKSIPPPPPSFKGFLFLRSLDIYVSRVCSSIIESIVAHSPLLEELTLDCYRFSEVKICALNLKYLHLWSVEGHVSLCTPLLQELKGNFETTRSFSIGAESLVFHHLRTIELSYVPFDDKEVTPAVISLIIRSPNLQKLEIFGLVSSENGDSEPDCFLDTESAPDITYNSLKVIKTENCDGDLNEMKLIKFLLARSPVLETLIYKLLPSISDKKLLKLMTKLPRYRRASANSQIVISKK